MSRYEYVRPARYGSERRVNTGVDQYVPNHQKMYSYMHLAAAVRNAPSQCQQQPLFIDAKYLKSHTYIYILNIYIYIKIYIYIYIYKYIYI